MSVSKEQKLDLARHVLEHPALEETIREAHMELFDQWLTAPEKEREEIIALRHGMSYFIRHLRMVRDRDRLMTEEKDNG